MEQPTHRQPHNRKKKKIIKKSSPSLSPKLEQAKEKMLDLVAAIYQLDLQPGDADYETVEEAKRIMKLAADNLPDTTDYEKVITALSTCI